MLQFHPVEKVDKKSVQEIAEEVSRAATEIRKMEKENIE